MNVVLPCLISETELYRFGESISHKAGDFISNPWFPFTGVPGSMLIFWDAVVISNLNRKGW